MFRGGKPKVASTLTVYGFKAEQAYTSCRMWNPKFALRVIACLQGSARAQSTKKASGHDPFVHFSSLQMRSSMYMY